MPALLLNHHVGSLGSGSRQRNCASDRLVVRRGKKRAIIAVAHSLLKSIWYMLAYHVPYQDLGGDYFDKRRKDTKINYHLRQLQKLGYSIQIEPQLVTG